MNPGLSPSSSPETVRAYRRLLARLEGRQTAYAAAHPEDWAAFKTRLADNFERLFTLLKGLYGAQYDFFYHLERLLDVLAEAWAARPAELKQLDGERERRPDWFQSNEMLGGVCYVDLFAGDLAGLRSKIPYFKHLGLTYLHLMPLFRTPPGENDGGYAIASYREVNPALGTVDELAELAAELRQAGISLVLDFVFNHTSDMHDWALRGRAGNPDYRDFYLMFPDRSLPDAYERTLREIFPDEHAGAFTWFPDIQQWVWTTFHSYQWDLNYANPAVFSAMAGEMLALANLGVEALRLDAVAFIWKRMGTSCENLPEAHQIIQAFNAAARIAAPSLLFKSEAIVHPDEVARYISMQECQISYNPLLMALLWEALATREVRLLAASMKARFAIPQGCAWVNYVRCHDDIGWTFSDEDAASIGINGYDHRRFLNEFYTGRFPGSFGRGLPFQENPKTGDCRISGTCASLAGLEKALGEETEHEVSLAVGRILLIHGVILTMGGIPLIYLGDEIATLNDYGYREDPAKAGDSRWVHRPKMDWERAEALASPLPEPVEGNGHMFPERAKDGVVEGNDTAPTSTGSVCASARVYAGLQRLIALRKEHPVFAGGDCQVLESGHPAVFAYLRRHGKERALVLANFSEREAEISGDLLRKYGEGWVDLTPPTEPVEVGGGEGGALPLPSTGSGNGSEGSNSEPHPSTSSGCDDVEASGSEGIGLTLAPYDLICLREREK